MSSYCADCGERQPTLGPQICHICDKYAAVFLLDDPTYGRLWSAAVQVALTDVGIPEFFFNPRVMDSARPEAAPSWYNPTPPGVLGLTLTRPPEEVVLSLAHELGHALLHPVGSEDDMATYQQHPVSEERLVHAAADAVARQFDITDYLSRMRDIGATGCVSIDELEPTERPVAEHLASELLRLLSLHE
jgi:hypothetical protein